MHVYLNFTLTSLLVFLKLQTSSLMTPFAVAPSLSLSVVTPRDGDAGINLLANL